MKSEGKPGTKLPVARQLLRGGLAERAVCQIAVEPGKVHPVEDVEELKAQLKVNPFGQVSNFVEVDVGLGEVRLPELIGLLISFPTQSRGGCELTGGENSVQKCVLGVSLVVALHVRIVIVVAVGIKIAAFRLIRHRRIPRGARTDCTVSTESQERRRRIHHGRVAALEYAGAADTPAATH